MRGIKIYHYIVLSHMATQYTAAGVEKTKVHPHAFRHLFAKEYMKTYRNIAELSCVLGHESVETTMIYLANSSREYIERVSGLDL